jgi:transcriptional regulator with XRE-family HTH domain
VGDLLARARELRETAGVSQRQMAAHVGIAQSVLASWETGRIAAPGAARPAAARRWLAALQFVDATADRPPS